MPEPAWSNWSGSVRCSPRAIEEPQTEAALSSLVRRAGEQGSTVRAVGAGHSSTGILIARDVLASLARIRGLQSHDASVPTATLGPGTTVREAGDDLLAVGLALEYLGDVDYQTVAGAIGTGTHGTGTRYPNISGQLIGGRLVTGTGEVIELSAKRDPELLRAARVSLGTLGIFTAVRLRARPLCQRG